MKIRDEYTEHKHLSTLQDKYLSYVPEEITEEDLWRGVPVNLADSDSSPKTDDEVVKVIKKYEL